MTRGSVLRSCCALILNLVVLGRSGAQITPTFHQIARSNAAFPGRDGYVYDGRTGSPWIGAKSIDPNGDIYFEAKAQAPDGTSLDDLLVYRRGTGVVEPYVRTGDAVGGVTFRQTWSAVGGGQPGLVSHIGFLQDGTPGDAKAVVVARADGSRAIAARVGQQPPGYTQPATFSNVGFASGGFNDVNLNRSGVASYGARFTDASGATRYGYYLTRPDQSAERIIDSTMPVPDHPGATWVAYDLITVPFDIYTPGLDDAGNAYFRAKFAENGKNYRAFYRRTASGALNAIVDTSVANSVPSLPGFSFGRLTTAANNQRGDVALGAAINNPDGTSFGAGVFVSRDGGPLTKVLAHGDPVPAIPEATNHTPGLIAMNDSGRLLLTLDYSVGSLTGESLLLVNSDGSSEPVLRFDQTPGFPGLAATNTLAADLNSAGDAVFITNVGVTTTYAAFAYRSDTKQLIPLLKTGDVLDGLTVVSMGLGGGADDPLGSIGASAGPISFDDARRLSMSVVLRDAAGTLSYAFYSVQVPEPNAAMMFTIGAAIGLRTAARVAAR